MNRLIKFFLTFITLTTAFTLNATEIQVMPTREVSEQSNQEDFNSYVLPPENTPSTQNEYSNYRASNESENESEIQPPPPEAINAPVPEDVVPPQE